MKADYSKVEEALTEGLRKMEIDRLWRLSDPTVAGSAATAEAQRQERRLLLTALRHDLQYLRKMKKDPFLISQFKQDEVIGWLQNPETLSPPQWEQLQLFKKHINDMKANLKKQQPEIDEVMMEEKRKSENQKRFNVKDKWIPLQ